MGLFNRFKTAISNSSSKLSNSIGSIFTKKAIDEDSLDELEELLIMSDFGAKCSADIVNQLRQKTFDKNDLKSAFIRKELATIIEKNLNKQQKSFELLANELNVILLCGVNGNGKTTSIGKLAYYYRQQGKKVMVAACDTFRAAAVEQLETWCNRANCQIIKGEEKQDPASVAHLAVNRALEEKFDILFIDTAGRLHNNTNLMQELNKISKVVEKFGIRPRHTLLVLDATTGQNAIIQANKFQEFAGIDGIIVTKLDGTAKAGVLVNISANFALPVYFVGIGEKIDDIKIFEPAEFANAITDIGDK